MSQSEATQPELTPEQQQLWDTYQEMLVALPKDFKLMKDACQFSLADSKGPLAFVTTQLAEVKQAKQALQGQKPGANREYAEMTLTIAEKMFAGSKRMLEIQGEYDRKNLALANQGLELVATAGEDPNVWVRLDQEGGLSGYKFALPLESVEFLEARAQTNFYFGLHCWMACLDSIDAVLRSTGNQPAIVCQSPTEEEGRAKLAQIFKDAMAADREVAVQVGNWGTELQETSAYFDWGSALLKGLEGKPADAKRAVLSDPDWQKLNGKVVLLATLSERAHAIPALAPYFPAPELPELPYEPLEWREPGQLPAGTGRLSGGTGRLAGGTGRLSGQTGRLKP